MNSAERLTVLHCLKSMIDEEACEECPLYGMTGTDHCEKDCVRLAITALEQEPCKDVSDINDGNIYECPCGYGWDKNKVVRHHFCPNCGRAVDSTELEPCTDAISRQAVLEILNNAYFLKLDDGAALQESVNQLPPVKPNYTDAEIQKMQDLEFAEIQKAYEIGKEEGSSEKPNKWIDAEVLDKIRAEIMDFEEELFHRPNTDYADYAVARHCVEIIDKYKASPTGAEGSDKE